ncbi:RNA polymerase sigma factor [Rossellomorea sp. NPDC077527]|uniref:RNA polymerase sigma factor n=1 Tax=Rossellomorea sp. NPDC077527 TaxID=3364510 RepID=UPI0037C63131
MVDAEELEVTISKLYQEHYLDVYKFLICFSGNRNDAEDLTQEVFIRVLHHFSRYNHQSSIKTWILSIAKHVAIDHYRKKKFVSIFKEGFFKRLVAPGRQPIEELEEKELQAKVHDAIARLKPEYRSIVILRGINELSVKETSDILQCSQSKVKVSYHRALKELKKKLNVEAEEVLRHAR